MLVARNRVKPGQELGAFSEPMCVARSGEPSFLKEVLGDFPLSAQTTEKPPDRFAIAQIDHVERALLPVAQTHNELAIR